MKRPSSVSQSDGAVLEERARRLWAAAGLPRETIRNGRLELARGVEGTTRIRRAGAGRPRLNPTQPGRQAALEALVQPLTRR